MFCQFSLLNVVLKSASSSPLYVQCPNSDSHHLFLAWFMATATTCFPFFILFPITSVFCICHRVNYPKLQSGQAFHSRNLPMVHHCLQDIPQVLPPVIQNPLGSSSCLASSVPILTLIMWYPLNHNSFSSCLLHHFLSPCFCSCCPLCLDALHPPQLIL